jgi:hypothetical protein
VDEIGLLLSNCPLAKDHFSRLEGASLHASDLPTRSDHLGPV